MMSGRQASSSSSRRGGAGEITVGDFRVGDGIGKGSFATVYRGHHKDGSLVAIKSVNLLKLSKKLKENLYSEIDILKTLQHPHIVALIDCKESTTHIHVVTELCEMGDLAGFIKKRDKHHTLPATADMARKYPSTNPGGVHEVIVRSYLKQLASALKFLRDRNFIHRDVKPQNILLCPSVQYTRTLRDAPKIMNASESSDIPNAGVESLPMLKIADFGFARALPTGGLADTLCGSPLYMAPEILRYEKYDAKADLWSVGTVLYELMTGKPPFRASNHVELLRKIEQAGDQIRFPENAVVSRSMKNIIRGLLRRNPVDRMPFVDFFSHEVITGPIPGLVEDDVPKEIRLPSRRSTLDPDRLSRIPPSPTGRPGSLLANEISQSPDPPLPPIDTRKASRSSDHSRRSGQRSVGDEVNSDIPVDQKSKRPTMGPSATTPANVQAIVKQISYKTPCETTGLTRGQPLHERISQRRTAQEQQAAQDVADERDYVVVHKGAVFANSLADELAADPRLASGNNKNQQVATRPVRRDRSNTVPTPEPVSKAVQIVRDPKAPAHQRQNSYERRYGPSPNSATSALSKALHGASVRLYGVGVNFLKGQSPPPLYSPFPSFTSPKGNFGLIEDKPSAAPGDDEKAVHDVEEAATISDVVYCFAEVKYKQLVPWTPSTTIGSGFGGQNARGNRFGKSKPDQEAQPAAEDDEDQFGGLSLDAVITVCEEALVLYVKALSLLAKALQTASVWWDKKGRGTVSTGIHSSRSEHALHEHGARINSAVQWARSRFNEVLEKAEFVRMKLVESQKQLPTTHHDHPSNRESASRSGGAAASADGVHLGSGVTAEKILYERATEMCRHAAVDEIANEDLPGCEVSYTTALRLLEAVLENDDDISSAAKRTPESKVKAEEGGSVCLDVADRQLVEKMVAMIRNRLHALRKKLAMIARHQSLPNPSPRSSHSSTPTIISTPPK